MNASRQPKLRMSLRIWAVVSLLAWLGASVFCAGDALLGHPHGDGEGGHATAAGQPRLHHAGTALTDSAASHSHSHDSDKSDGDDGHDEDSCCSTLKCVPQAAGSFILSTLDFAKFAYFHFAFLSQTPALSEPENGPPRQASPRNWVFTPEVCLGPAFRSLAPPSLG
jgi:hypothetical protein